jgi:hypothetical protein
MIRESVFVKRLIRELLEKFPGAVILKNDPNVIQGIPDRLILYGDRWAALETKRDENARVQRNQHYYIGLLDEMSYATFVNPQNKETVLNELQQALRPSGGTRFPFRK